uniref:Uncharacterized protein n=1 Tax=Gorilla gorilla gorilla TaxID=9595 RepID=A0A2I2Y3N6_GORGO
MPFNCLLIGFCSSFLLLLLPYCPSLVLSGNRSSCWFSEKSQPEVKFKCRIWLLVLILIWRKPLYMVINFYL